MEERLTILALLTFMLIPLTTVYSSTIQIDLASIEFQRVVFNKSPTLLAQDIVVRDDVKEVIKEIDVNGRYEALIYLVERSDYRAYVIVGRVFELNGKAGSWDFIEVRSTIDASTVVKVEVTFYRERNLITVSEGDVEKLLVKGFSVSSRLNIRLPIPEGYYPNEGVTQTNNFTRINWTTPEPFSSVETPLNTPIQENLTEPNLSLTLNRKEAGGGKEGLNFEPIIISFSISVILSIVAYFVTKRFVSE